MSNTKEYRKLILIRYLKTGVVGFIESEFLELLLSLTLPRQDVRQMAVGLLTKFGSFKTIQDAPMSELLGFPKMDMKTAVLLKAVKDSAEYYLKEQIINKKLIRNGLDFIKYCRLSMEGLRDECFKVAFLNTQYEVIEVEVVQTGTVDESPVYPRKIIERALHHNAVGLILMHNHPGGCIHPSNHDLQITHMIMDAAEVMDMTVHDHIIVGKDGYFSFMEAGLLSCTDHESALVSERKPGRKNLKNKPWKN